MIFTVGDAVTFELAETAYIGRVTGIVTGQNTPGVPAVLLQVSTSEPLKTGIRQNIWIDAAYARKTSPPITAKP